MSRYQNVTQEEMEPFLQVRGFQPLTLPNTRELTYAKLVHLPEGTRKIALSLRIYTGIVDGKSRGKGQDAIRLCLFKRDKDGAPKMIGAAKRVHRVVGWRKNLEDRLNSWEQLLGPCCPRCGSLMVLRQARLDKKNKFWGCSNFPECRGTRNIEKDDEDGEPES